MQKRMKCSLYMIVLSLIMALPETNYCAWAEVNVGSSGSESLFQYVRTDLTQGYIEALARGNLPSNVDIADGIFMARDSAIENLNFSMVEFIVGAYLESASLVSETMTSTVTSTGNEQRHDLKQGTIHITEVKRNEISRIVTRNIEVTKEEWDGDFYLVYGRIPLSEVSAFLAAP